ncbi:hypothetical protein XENOCAPTIV_020213, partial [Xenoophorus captivus]
VSVFVHHRFSNENGGKAPFRPRQHQAGGDHCSNTFFFLFEYLIPILDLVLRFLMQALIQDIYSELVEDACLGLCFEVHRAVKQGYFFLDETDQDSIKEFGWC